MPTDSAGGRSSTPGCPIVSDEPLPGVNQLALGRAKLLLAQNALRAAGADDVSADERERHIDTARAAIECAIFRSGGVRYAFIPVETHP